MKRILFLIIPSILILASCENKEKKLTETFVNKVWILDSIKSKSMENMYIQDGSWDGKGKSPTVLGMNKILKPIVGGKFDVHRDNGYYFNEYKISNDTLYLSKSENTGFSPFSFEKLGEYSFRAVPLKGVEPFFDDIYYFTDVTDLFNGKVVNSGELYEKINGSVWYPIKSWKLGELVYDDPRPDYYVHQIAFETDNDSMVYSHIWEEGTILKFTEKSLYLFNPKDETIQTFKAKIKDNELMLEEAGLGVFKFLFKKVGRAVLQDGESLPMNYRLNCSEPMARFQFEARMISYDDDRWVHDIESIKLVENEDVNCRYVYTIVRKSREFRNITHTFRYELTFLEGGIIAVKLLE